MSADSRQAEHGTDIPAPEGPGSGGPVGPAPSGVSQERIVLRLEDVSVRYGAVRALDGVNFVARQGEVVGLVGDNGAGKSTMVKVIAGTITPEAGRIFVDDIERRWESPHAALAAGIETVFQDGGLAPHLSVASNLFLGREIFRDGILGRMGFLNQGTMEAQAEQALAHIGMTRVPPGAGVGRLSGGQRQAVAVARPVVWARKILILDEPTNHLGVTEVVEVLRLVREVRSRGICVIFISHTLPYVIDVCDRIVTMRLGQVVSDYRAAEVTTDQLVSDMTGSSVAASL